MENNRGKNIIGAASAYNKGYYFNEAYGGLPSGVKDEVRRICVFYAEKLHCEFSLYFNGEGNVLFETGIKDGDINFDEIGAELDLRKLSTDQRDFFISLELWHKTFVLKNGEPFDE